MDSSGCDAPGDPAAAAPLTPGVCRDSHVLGEAETFMARFTNYLEALGWICLTLIICTCSILIFMFSNLIIQCFLCINKAECQKLINIREEIPVLVCVIPGSGQS